MQSNSKESFDPNNILSDKCIRSQSDPHRQDFFLNKNISNYKSHDQVLITDEKTNDFAIELILNHFKDKK